MTSRDGFALLAVLWLVVALGGVSAGALASVRAGMDASVARATQLRARWAAEGCLAAATAALAEETRAGRQLALPPLAPLRFANGASCAVAATDPGADPASPYNRGKINVNAAGDSVLLAIPGFGYDVLRTLEAARTWRRPIASLDEILWTVPPSARPMLLAHYAELRTTLAFAAASLVLTARGEVTGQPGTAVAELHVAPAGGRIAILHRRLR